MANPGKMHQELQQRQLEAKDDNITTIKWCVIIMAINCLLWTNPIVSWHGAIWLIDALSRGHWGQGATIAFYGLGLLGIAIPAFFALKASKQLSATSTNKGP